MSDLLSTCTPPWSSQLMLDSSPCNCGTDCSWTPTSARLSFWARLLSCALQRLQCITSVVVAGSALPVSSQVKSLGVIIDSHMRFDSHVRAVVRSCNYTILAPCSMYANSWLLRRRRSIFQIVWSKVHESTEKTLTGKRAVFTWLGPD